LLSPACTHNELGNVGLDSKGIFEIAGEGTAFFEDLGLRSRQTLEQLSFRFLPPDAVLSAFLDRPPPGFKGPNASWIGSKP
jgi:hypothetical protein